MKVQVIYFGLIKDIVQRSKEELELKEQSTISDLKLNLSSQYPELEKHIHAVAINEVITPENLELNEGDEIAFMPAFSGG